MTAEPGPAEPFDLAHELRTPLHTILTAADLVLSGDAGPISAQAAGLVGEIARAARRLEALSRDLVVGGGRWPVRAGPDGEGEGVAE